MKVRKRTPVVDAWQHDGSPARTWPTWVQNCVTRKHVGGETHLLLHRRSGIQVVNLTDWLVRNLDGEPEWMTDPTFVREDYEQVGS